MAVDIPELSGKHAPVSAYTEAFGTYPQDGGSRAGLRLAAGRPVSVRAPGLRDRGRGGPITRDVPDRDKYYVGPEHLRLVTAGTIAVEFSMTKELQKTPTAFGTTLDQSALSA